ncbi:MAG: tRNA (N(6)-L-threonylcarbamoyladenosine(37)-C(2))-methylthiotransferase MtaB [Ruminococcus sp.]|nr:tRNA (N(6)-L-threonylcarbamoyladenosine(37)-C(2))-methylthiotransferase MtaB [Ruminococcus sp.]
MNFNIITLGCKVNQYESQAMKETLLRNGFTVSEDKEKADITIINTCTVTSVSDAKNRKILHKARRNNPSGIIVLTGCMPQAFPDDFDTFKDCDIVLGNYARNDLIPTLERYFNSPQQLVIIKENQEKAPEYEKLSVTDFGEHTRAFVKIEDGCNRFCSYCIIPYARGRVRSKTIEDLKLEVENLAQNGYKEIVLVGINLSAYGQDIDKNLCDAVEAVCENDKILRVRLGSLEPEQMDEAVINRLSEQEKLCPQFHLSLQSGCDETLKRMNRHYDTKIYSEIVSNLRKTFNNCAITTDVMVGFAGETEEEFKKSLDFVKNIAFSKVHVFPYSRRKGTVADKAPNQVNEKIKGDRAKEMIALTDNLREQFLKSQVGLMESVLFETMKNNDFCVGYTENYTPVRVYTKNNLCGQVLNVKIINTEKDYCIGELI